MLTNLCVSAPGKIILHGEHSVVHGKKAIACAIGSRVIVEATCQPSATSILTIDMPDINLHEITLNCDDLKIEAIAHEDFDKMMSVLDKKCAAILDVRDSTDLVRIAFLCVLYAYFQTFGRKSVIESITISVTIKSEIPIGAGLGSSAAFNTSIACLFLMLSQTIRLPDDSKEFSEITDEVDLNAVNALAYELEKIVHKTPSGIDNSIASFGGAVAFQNGEIRKIKKMPILKILIVDSKVSRSTKTLVSKVKEYLASNAAVVSPILESMDAIATVAESLLESLCDDNSNAQALSEWGRLIETNQHLLGGIGVSHAALDKICSIARKFGCPAKLTGAGGGGCAIVLLDFLNDDHDAAIRLEKELTLKGFNCIKASLGGRGILVKNTGKS